MTMATGELFGKRIVLGITGGIAAYKAAELVRLLAKAGAHVDVVLTAGGAQFVTAVTFQALSGNPVWTDLWDARVASNMAHIDLTREADMVLVAPATADFIAKLVHGMADDLLTTLCLAREIPLLVAPAMNRQMWENPSTQRNIAQLAVDGVTVLGPAAGDQACGEVGMGRMLEPADLLEAVIAFLQPKRLVGKRVLLTAGPTQEPLDPVRVLTNLSSGKMGYALARALRHAGADVALVSGPVSLPTPYGVERIDVSTALQMREAVLDRASKADVFIGVAAVADYRPATASSQKIKKTPGGLALELVANPDILAEVAALPNPPFCVGFAAESENLGAYAQGKRVAKKLPLVIGNLVQDGLGSEENSVTLFDESGAHPLPRADKDEVARAIVAHLCNLLGN